MENIHSTAIVSPKAKLGKNVKVDAYAIINDDVEIDDDSYVGPHAIIYDGARLGKRVKIFQGASVANLPQDLKYDNEVTHFFIGDGTIIREFVTLHKGTKHTGFSRVGKNCFIMAYSHVAHDCTLGDNCILANSVQIGGHVTIEDWVIIGGGTVIHQNSLVGQHSMIGGGFRIIADIPPFVLGGGEPLRYSGVNLVGLRRRGFTNEDIYTIKDAYKILYLSGMNFGQAKEKMKEKYSDNRYVNDIIEFLNKSKRGIIRR